MSLPRIYQPQNLVSHSLVKLDDQASHHLARVLRAKAGDPLILFNGQGGEYEAVITHVDKKGVEVRVMAFKTVEVESLLQIHLAQGIARGEKMDFIVQKAVELGVTTIAPLLTERCNVRLAPDRMEKRLQHWQGVIISACEQSGRNQLAQLVPATSFKHWLANVKADYRFVLSPWCGEKLSVQSIQPSASLVLLIGPEGGLSEEEVAMAVENGFMPLNLGPRVLRTETATLAAIVAIQTLYGDFGN